MPLRALALFCCAILLQGSFQSEAFQVSYQPGRRLLQCTTQAACVARCPAGNNPIYIAPQDGASGQCVCICQPAAQGNSPDNSEAAQQSPPAQSTPSSRGGGLINPNVGGAGGSSGFGTLGSGLSGASSMSSSSTGMGSGMGGDVTSSSGGGSGSNLGGSVTSTSTGSSGGLGGSSGSSASSTPARSGGQVTGERQGR